MSHPVTTFDAAEDAVLPEDGDLGAFEAADDHSWEKHLERCAEKAALYAIAHEKADLSGESHKAWIPSVVEKHMKSCVLILI